MPSARVVSGSACIYLKLISSFVVCAVIISCGSGAGSPTNNSSETPGLGAAMGSDDNQPPAIESISIGCDLVLDSIGLVAGEVADFTLAVNDESPLTLTYAIESDETSISTSSVDTDGVFTLVGVKTGETTMPIIVTDEHGLSTQLLLSVTVDS